MKKNFIHFMHPRIQRFNANGQFHRTGTYAGSAVAIKLNIHRKRRDGNRPSVCYFC
jgi:hypothetical protein